MKNKQLHNDALGLAYSAYWGGDENAEYTLYSTMFDPDTIAVSHFFRAFQDMPLLEQIALTMCTGRVLDVGAGTGTHSLVLQERGFDPVALDISPLAVEVMVKRGIQNVVCDDFFSASLEKFDTILLLMNGIGLIQSLERFPDFFAKIDELLEVNGQVLLDSSDLRYLYQLEDGSYQFPLDSDYYGLVDYRVGFKKYISEPFYWVYVDFDVLQHAALQSGFLCELVKEGEHFDYIARLVRK